MLVLSSILIGTNNQQNLVDFYNQVFNKAPDMSENNITGWVIGNLFFSVGEHSEISGPNKEPARFIFNLDTNDVNTEFERIKNLGATVIKEPYDIDGMWIATLADPDGNYFQLVTPWDNRQT